MLEWMGSALYVPAAIVVAVVIGKTSFGENKNTFRL